MYCPSLERVFLVRSSFTNTVHVSALSGGPRAAGRMLALHFRDVWLAFVKTTDSFWGFSVVLYRNA